jgi:hypothetical protein
MLEGLEPITGKRRCKTRATLEGLESGDNKILTEALADKSKWSDKGLSVALQQRGIQLSNEAIGRHRRELCSCYE